MNLTAASQAYIYAGTVTRVVDGDTLDAELSLDISVGFGQSVRLLIPQRFRLVDVNAPEGRDGALAAAHARDRLLGRPVEVHSLRKDRYGRRLARVFVAGQDFGAELVAMGLAVPYRVGEGGI